MQDDDVETQSLPAVQPAPAELVKAKRQDFASTVERLEKRAVAARHRARWTAAILVLGGFGAGWILLSSQLYSDNAYVLDNLRSARSEAYRSIEEPLARRITHLMDKMIGPTTSKERESFKPPTREETASLQAEIKSALEDYEKAAAIAAAKKPSESSAASLVGPVVSTVVFSVGAIGLLILMIQISVMFIRYHLRLAELMARA